MKRFRKSLLFVTSILYFFTAGLFFLPNNVYATTYFEDDFSSGNLDKWEPMRGTYSNWTISNNELLAIPNGQIVELVPKNLYWNDPFLSRYIYELDITPIEGVNRNISFRVQSTNIWEEIHHTNDRYGWYKIYLERVFPQDSQQLTSVQLLESGNQMLENGLTYHFKIIVDKTKTKVYITEPGQTERLIIDYDDVYSPLLGGKIGLKSIHPIWFDNVKVTLLPDEIATPNPTIVPTATPTQVPTPTPTIAPTPTASPTPTPTSTATPAPTLPSLNVPSLKQYEEPWQNNLYDHTLATVKQWGCALTSAAMILQYHGHNIMPDVLNTWLNSQSDGYISNGLINWLAISRYTKLHDSASSPTLEYKRLIPTDINLTREIENNRPAILKESGHFVVAKSILTSTFGINDPGYANRNDLTSYSNLYLAINSFIPTHSDLSYMMFTADSDIILELVNSSGNIIPTQNYIEEPISDIDDPNNKSGEPLSVLIFEKPTSGKYILKISGGVGSYNLNTYLYKKNGEVTQDSFSGMLSEDKIDTYDVTFDPETIDNDVKIDEPPIITIDPYNTDWTNQDITVTASTNEGVINTTTHIFTINDSFDFVAIDNAGNITNKTVTITNIDKAAPNAPELVTTVSPTNLTSQNWNWTTTNEDIEAESYIWRIPGFSNGSVFTNSLTTNLTEGFWNFFVKTKDRANNESPEAEGQVTVDTTDPEADWVYPIADSTVTGVVPLNFSATDALSGVNTIFYFYKRNDGLDEFHLTNSNWDTTDLAIDTYTLRATVTDNAGNTKDFDLFVNISAIISSISSTTPSFDSAIITWTTDKPTKSRIVYDTVSTITLGLSPNYGYTFSTATFDSSPKVTSHSVTITGLSSGTTYYYRTISEGSPVAISDQKEFRTLSIAGSPSQSGGNMTPSIITPLFTTPQLFKTVFAEEVLGTETENQDLSTPVQIQKTEVKGTSKNNSNIRNVILIIASIILAVICIRLLFGKTKKYK